MENTFVTLPLIVCAGILGLVLIGLALRAEFQHRRSNRRIAAKIDASFDSLQDELQKHRGR